MAFFANTLNFSPLGVDPLSPIEGQVWYNHTERLFKGFDGLAVFPFNGKITHSSLLGLTADDHQQYLLVNGTRQMTGDLNMGSFSVVMSGGTVDGVLVSSHAARHLTGGADPIPVATALTDGLMPSSSVVKLSATGVLSDDQPEVIGTTSPGVSLTASRSDHVHEHGSQLGGLLHSEVIAGGDAGFISGSDKTKLDNLLVSAQVPSGGLTSQVLTKNSNTNYDMAWSSVAASVPPTRTLTAGAGLTGGGDLSADRTFDVVANADGSIVVNANDIQVGVLATDAQHGNRGNGSLHAVATTLVAGFMSTGDKTYLDALAAFTQGSVPFAGGDGKLTQDNTYFFWDNTNKRLGVGINSSLLARLDAHETTLGNLLVRLSTATGGGLGDVNYSVSQYRTTTTNNTDANLATIPTQSNRAYLIEARIVAARTGGTAGTVGDNAMFIRTARASNIGGVLTINNVQSTYTHRDQAGWTANISSSGTNILVVINGNLNNNVEWHGTVIVQEIRYT